MNGQSLDPWLFLKDRDTKARIRLFCFPYAGGGASLYRSWKSPTPGSFEVWPVQLPARENRINETPFTRLDPLIVALEHALLRHVQHPFAFFGHSLGGLIAFELACRLRSNHGIVPAHLFVSGRSAPHIVDADEPMHTLPDPELKRRLRKLNGTPEDVLAHDELMSLALPLLKADFAISETYSYAPREPLSCPISAFGGSHDTEVSSVDLDAWRLHTRLSFRLRICPGDHFFIHANRDALLSAIESDLALSRGSPAS
ncbi:MAG: alpha/beta fold hydrolase [Candidatus Solibacter sp.]